MLPQVEFPRFSLWLVLSSEEGKASAEEENAVTAFLELHLDLYAEAEHLGWEEQRRIEGWVYAPPPKDNEKRTQPLLVPYSEYRRPKRKRTAARSGITKSTHETGASRS